MLRNFIYQALYQILTLLLPFITLPYISRVLGVEGIGTYAYSFAIVSYFVSFANMGVNVYGNREIAAVQYDREKRSQQFWDLFIVQLLFSGISLFIYVFVVIYGDWEDKLIFLIQGIYILGQAIDINWFYFGMEKFKITVTRNLMIKLITTFLIFLFVNTPSDLIEYILILALGTTLGNSAVWLLIKNYIVWKKPRLNNIKKSIKPIVILMIPSFAVKMYTQMDKVFIKIFGDINQVGYYESAEKIVSLAFILITSLSTILLPRMAKLHAKEEREEFRNIFRRSISVVSWLTIALMFGMIGIADTFVNIYLGKEYLSCIVLIIVLAITIPFKGCAEIVRRGYIIPTKCDYIYVLSIFIGAGVNVLINLLLIPKMGAIGAAIGTVIAELLVFFIQAWKIRKNIKIFHFLSESNSYFIVGIIMLFCIRWVCTFTLQLGYIRVLLLQVVMGVCIYFLGTGIIFKLKNKSIKELLSYIRLNENRDENETDNKSID